jgi:short chain dehydrogenase
VRTATAPSRSKRSCGARGFTPAGRVHACALDVTDERSLRRAARWVGRRLGHCDALVNNAAILYDTPARASSANLNEVRAGLETNLLGAWRATLAFLPLIRSSPHPRIVNVSSEGGSLASMSAGTPTDSVSKAAPNAFSRREPAASPLRGRTLLAPEKSGSRSRARRRPRRHAPSLSSVAFAMACRDRSRASKRSPRWLWRGDRVRGRPLVSVGAARRVISRQRNSPRRVDRTGESGRLGPRPAVKRAAVPLARVRTHGHDQPRAPRRPVIAR